MADPIQMVRVDDVIAEGVGVLNGSILLVWDGQYWVPVDVIELTEQPAECRCGAWLSHLCDCQTATVRLKSEPRQITRVPVDD